MVQFSRDGNDRDNTEMTTTVCEPFMQNESVCILFVLTLFVLVLCQVYFYDLSTFDHSVEGVAFPKADAPS